jgi:hypothetical protein
MDRPIGTVRGPAGADVVAVESGKPESPQPFVTLLAQLP